MNFDEVGALAHIGIGFLLLVILCSVALLNDKVDKLLRLRDKPPAPPQKDKQ